MRIIFRTKKLQKLCETFKDASRRWGPECARRLVKRMNEMESSECLKTFKKLPAPRCHLLTCNRKGQYAADLIHPKRLVFMACDKDGNPIKDAELILGEIKDIIIIDIGDYHG